MTLSIFARIIHTLLAVDLLLLGAGFLLSPATIIELAHNAGTPVTPSPLIELVAAGMLLAGALLLRSAIRGEMEKDLFLMSAAYLAAIPLVHGNIAFATGWWLWLPLALLLLGQVRLPATVPVPAPLANLGGQASKEGTVKWFNPNKGFGFIETENDGELFVHFKAITNGGRRSLRPGTKVRYVVRTTERGDQADEVEIINA